ncbi:hypothetical protein C8R43DRAFT_1135661 [Mycena crocata]|nr:hypothetical protein C8R43DRAFT_1135661 [Mycena crocata]
MPLAYHANSTTRPVISTAAPKSLRKLLRKKSHKPSSEIARRAIEHQLESYEEYISAPRKVAAGIPSLVDALAAKIPDSRDALDQIPDAVLSQHIWGWTAIAYPLFRQGLTRLEANSDRRASKRHKGGAQAVQQEVKDIDEWIILHEKYLGDSERLGDDWHHGLITIADADLIFPASSQTKKARTILRPTNLPGYAVLDSGRPPKIDIQPSTDAFKRTFDRLSDGLLKNLDWSNIVLDLDALAAASRKWTEIVVDESGYGSEEHPITHRGKAMPSHLGSNFNPIYLADILYSARATEHLLQAPHAKAPVAKAPSVALPSELYTPELAHGPRKYLLWRTRSREKSRF